MRCGNDSIQELTIVRFGVFFDYSGFAGCRGIFVLEAIVRQSRGFQSEDRAGNTAPEETSDVHPAYQSMLAVGFPAVAAADEGVEEFSPFFGALLSGDIHDPRFIMQYPMPYLDHAPNLPDNDMDHAMEVASNQPGRSGIDRSDVSMDISQADPMKTICRRFQMKSKFRSNRFR